MAMDRKTCFGLGVVLWWKSAGGKNGRWDVCHMSGAIFSLGAISDFGPTI